MADITDLNISVGSGELDITLSGFDGSNTTCDVSDIGTLDFEFDITEDESAKDSISSILGTVKLSIFDGLGDGTSFFNRFYAASSPITAEIVHTDNASVSNTYVFVVDNENISRPDLERNVTIVLKPDVDISFTVSQFRAGSTDWGIPNFSPFDDIVGGNSVSCSSVGEFISGTLNELNTNNSIVFNSNDFLNGALPSGSGADGDEEYVVVYGSCGDTSQLMIDEFMRIAICEGAIFGTGLGTNFWCYRGYTGDSVTLSKDEVEDFTAIIAYDEYKSIKSSFTGSACFSFQLADTENETVGFPQKPSTFDITTDVKVMSLGHYDWNGGTDPAWNTDVVTKDGTVLANNQNTAYRNALTSRPSSGKGLRCSITVHGFKTVKPWETVVFNTDFLTEYQTGEYRISQASYDWKADKASFELYRIS